MRLIRCTIDPQISHEARINHDKNVTRIEPANDSVPRHAGPEHPGPDRISPARLLLRTGSGLTAALLRRRGDDARDPRTGCPPSAERQPPGRLGGAPCVLRPFGFELTADELAAGFPPRPALNGFSPGFRPPPGQEAGHERRQHAVVKVGGQTTDSRHGLGGYHGSARVTPCGTAYYAVAVYSEPGNGVPVFGQPWKNIAATSYHQLNEARTDPDVDDAIRTGDSARLGWYSAKGGEIGDIRVNEAGISLPLVFREVDLADGSGAVPIQLMWSNKHDAPATRIA
jgi:hypothetical protein